jgi:hypothetical protein
MQRNGFPLFADLASSPYALVALVLLILGAALTIAGIAALLRARPLRFVLRTLAGLLLLALGLLFGVVGVGVQGYRALTHEEVAAVLAVKPAGKQRFEVAVNFPDGRSERFELAGDEVYVDAYILKWTPLANFFGLHTSYELDRIAGRYRAIDDEKNAPRTVHQLGRDRPVNLFGMRQRYLFLEPLLDAEYGSATYVPVVAPSQIEVRVSPFGLLMRPVAAAKSG